MSSEFRITRFMVKSSSEICRLCLTEDIKQSKRIFDKRESSTIASMVMLCARVQVAFRDGLPDIICAQCLRDLEAANSFRFRCELADSLLRKSRGAEQGSKRTQSSEDEVFSEEWIESEFEDIIGQDEPSDPLATASTCGLSEDASYEKSPLKNGFCISARTLMREKECTTNANDGKFCNSLQGSSYPAPHCENNKTEDEYLKCDICQTIVQNVHYLKVHKMFCSAENPFDSNYDYLQKYSKIIKTKRMELKEEFIDSDKPVCYICREQFSSEDHLQIHMDVHVDTCYLCCEYCQCVFVDKERLKKHLEFHNNRKMYECDICGYKNSKKQALIAHLIFHLKE